MGTDRDWIEVWDDLDEAGHVDLDRQLAGCPANLELRIKRLVILAREGVATRS